MSHTFSEQNFYSICDQLTASDADLRAVVQAYGYPPMWTRPNSFETLVHIILEQQVSLASARSALNRLQEKLKNITPETVLPLTDEEWRACYFSKQKMAYTRHLAAAISSGDFSLNKMASLPDDRVRTEMIHLKGIGNWTIDIYLMFVLRRTDIFPSGDLAAVNALKRIKSLPKDVSKESLLKATDPWRPYRTVATMMLWHYYLSGGMKSFV